VRNRLANFGMQPDGLRPRLMLGVRQRAMANRWILSGLALALAYSAAVEAQHQGATPLQPDDFTMAGLAEGMPSAGVRALLGAPQSVAGSGDLRDKESKLVSWRYKDLTVLLGSRDEVRGAWLSGASLATKRGLPVGDSRERVGQLYGTPAAGDDKMVEYADPNERSHVIRVVFKRERIETIFVGWVLD